MRSARRKIIIIISILMIAVGMIAATAWLRSSNHTGITAREQPHAGTSAPDPAAGAAVVALGRIEPGDGVIVIAAPLIPAPAIVENLLVKEGDAVESGQVLAELRGAGPLHFALVEAERKIAVAVAEVARARSRLAAGSIEALAAEVERRAVELDLARKNFERMTRLEADKASSTQDLDAARAQLESRQWAHEEARRRLAATRSERRSDLAVAEAGQAAVSAEKDRIAADLRAAFLFAPVSGRVLEIHARPGEAVGARGVMDLGETAALYAVAEVYEADLSLIKPGQRAEITGEGLPGKLQGTVERIGLTVRRNEISSIDPVVRTDARVVEVRIRLDDSAAGAPLVNLQVVCAIRR